MTNPSQSSRAEEKERIRLSIERELQERLSDGENVTPVQLRQEKKKSLSGSPWAREWQRELGNCSVYEGRLPKGRTLLRQGAVYGFEVHAGEIKALVAGDRLHETRVIAPQATPEEIETWRQWCQGNVGAFIDLLEGNFGNDLMMALMEPGKGLIPDWSAIRGVCNCLDDADICPHSAALLYALGALMDEDPSLLFRWRGIDPETFLKAQDSGWIQTGQGRGVENETLIPEENLGDLFGIDLESSSKG